MLWEHKHTSLDDDGESIFIREVLDLLVFLNSTLGARDNGDVGCDGEFPGRNLVAEGVDDFGGWADELNCQRKATEKQQDSSQSDRPSRPCGQSRRSRTRNRSLGVCQASSSSKFRGITRMDHLSAMLDGNLDNLFLGQIGTYASMSVGYPPTREPAQSNIPTGVYCPRLPMTYASSASAASR